MISQPTAPVHESVIYDMPTAGPALRNLIDYAREVSESPNILLLDLFHALAFSNYYDAETEDYTKDMIATTERCREHVSNELTIDDFAVPAEVYDLPDDEIEAAEDQAYEDAKRELADLSFALRQAFAADTAAAGDDGLELIFVWEEYEEERLYAARGCYTLTKAGRRFLESDAVTA